MTETGRASAVLQEIRDYPTKRTAEQTPRRFGSSRGSVRGGIAEAACSDSVSGVVRVSGS